MPARKLGRADHHLSERSFVVPKRTPSVSCLSLMADKRSQQIEGGYVSSVSAKLKTQTKCWYGSVLSAFAPALTSIFIWVLPLLVLLGSLSHLTPVKPAYAAINEQLNFQARLLNDSGGLVPDGNYNVQFHIYSGGDGDPSTADETLEWNGTHMNDNSDGVRVVNGYLSVQLGSSVSQTNTLADVDWNDSTLWLSINIGDTGSGSSCATEANFNSNCGGDGEMDPFMRLTSVPYAFNANRLDNLDSTDFVQLGQGLQTDASTNSSIAINKTGASGDILTLQDGGTTELLFDQNSNLTLGSASDEGTLVLYDGSSHTGTLQVASLGSNEVYTLPDSDGSDEICLLDLANCTGGGVTGSGNANRVAYWTSTTAIDDDDDFFFDGDVVGIGDITPDNGSKLDVTTSSTSTSAASYFGQVLDLSDTGVVTTGTDTTIGHDINVIRTGATGGTIVTTGLDINLDVDNAGSGTSRAIGLNVSLDGQGDNNYAALFNGGNIGIGTSTPHADYMIDIEDSVPINTYGGIRIMNTANTSFGKAGLFIGNTTNGTINAGIYGTSGALHEDSGLNIEVADDATTLHRVARFDDGSAYSLQLIGQSSTGGILSGTYNGAGSTTTINLYEAGTGNLIFQPNFSTADYIFNTSGGTQRLRIDSTGDITVNEPGGDIDFRVESDTHTDALIIQGSDGQITLGALDCSGNANGGAITANSSGVLSCTDDDGGGTSEWTDTGTFLHPADLSGAEDVGIGGTSTGTADIWLQATGAAVFNEQGNDADFRVESDVDVNAFFVQGSDGFVGIGTGSPTAGQLTISSGTTTTELALIGSGTTATFDLTDAGSFDDDLILLVDGSTDDGYFTFTNEGYLGINNASGLVPDALLDVNGGDNFNAWDTNGVQIQVNAGTFMDFSTSASGTATNAVFNSFAQSTLTANNSSVTTTNAATLYVQGAPIAGTNQTITNAYALWVDAGNVRFDAGAVFNEDGNDADFRVESDTNADALFVQGSDGYVGFGTNAPSARMHVIANTSENLLLVEDATLDPYGQITQNFGSGNSAFTFQSRDDVAGVRSFLTLDAYNETHLTHCGVSESTSMTLFENSFYLTYDGAGCTDNGTPEFIFEADSSELGVGLSSPSATLHIDGTAIFEAASDSSNIFDIQDAGGQSYLRVDTESSTDVLKVVVGAGTDDVVFTLDAFNTDPSGTIPDGSMFYDADGDVYRCRINGSWTNCDTTGGGSSEWTDTGTFLHPADLSGAEDVGIGGTTTGGSDIILFATGAATFNEQGAAVDFRVESDNTTGIISVTGSTDTISLGSTVGAATTTINSGTGNIDIGTSASARTINLGTGAAVVQTINVGGTGANVISIGNTQTGGSISLGAAMTTGTINIGGTGAQTGTITLGGGTGAQNINLGTGGTGVKTIAIGGSAANVITIGNSQTGGSISLGAAMTTGTINIGGTGAQTGTITLGGGTGAQAINLGAGGTAAKTVTLGSTVSTSSTTINSGTGNIDIGTSASARTINLGTGAAVVQTINVGGTGANVISVGNTQTGGSISLGAAMTTGTINIGGTGAQTGTITLGGGTGAQAINLGAGGTAAKTVTLGSTVSTSSTTINSGTGNIDIGTSASARTINLGTGAAVVQTINVGGTGANVISIGNTQTGGSISLGAAMTTGTISIGGTGAQTGTISLGTGTGAQSINLGTGGTAAKTVTLGSSASTSSTTIQGGTGDIILTSSDQIRLTGFNCSTFTNGGALTTDASGNVSCSNDDGGGSSEWTDTGTFLHPADLSGAEDVGIGGTSTGTADILLLATGDAVFNEQSNDADFRVESDTLTSALFVQGSDGFVGLGTSTPAYKLQVVSNGAGGTISSDSYGGASLFQGRRAGGTIGSETALSSGNTIVQFSGQGYGSTGFSSTRVAITMTANQDWTDANQGTRIAFHTTPDNTTTLVQSLALTHPSGGDTQLTINSQAAGDETILQFNQAGTGEWFLQSAANGTLFEIVESGAGTRLAVEETTGNVGIGDTSPDNNARLDVTTSSTSTSADTFHGMVLDLSDTGVVTTGTDTTVGHDINITRTGATGGTINTTGLDINVTADNAGAGTSTAIGLNVNVTGADTNYAAIFQGGNVGIGVAAPTNNLHIAHAASASILIAADTDNVTETDTAYLKLHQDAGASEGVVGLVGVNDFDPEGIAVTGLYANSLYIGTDTTVGGSALQFGTNDTLAMTILHSNQFVGIGTNAPGYNLQVGTNDTGTEKTIRIAGAGTGVDEGGQLMLGLAADHDTTFDEYNIDVFQDDFRIHNNGTVRFQINGSNGSFQFRPSSDSSTAFLIQEAGGQNYLTVDTTNLAVTIGGGTDDVTFVLDSFTTAPGSATDGAMFYDSDDDEFMCRVNGAWVSCDTTGGGGGGGVVQMSYYVEYPGGTLFADGSNNNGTLTATYDSTQRINYYQWTSSQATLQDYDFVIHTQVPSDFSAANNTSWYIYAYSSDYLTEADNEISVRVYEGATQCNTTDLIINDSDLSANNTWAEVNLGSMAGCTFNANDTIRIEVKVSARNSDLVRIGSIRWDYDN